MIKQKIKINLFTAILLTVFACAALVLSSNSIALADHGDLHCKDGTPVVVANKTPGYSSDFCADKGGVDVEAGCDGEGTCESTEAENKGSSSDFEGDCNDSIKPEDCGITSYIRLFTNGLSALVGIVIVVMVVVGGIQYSMARDNPQAVAAARQKIINAVLALLLFVFMFAFLQWIIPGGLF